MTSDQITVFQVSAVITSIIQLGGFSVAYAKQTEKFYDILGGLNYLVLALYSATTTTYDDKVRYCTVLDQLSKYLEMEGQEHKNGVNNDQGTKHHDVMDGESITTAKHQEPQRHACNLKRMKMGILFVTSISSSPSLKSTASTTTTTTTPHPTANNTAKDNNTAEDDTTPFTTVVDLERYRKGRTR